MKRKAYAITLVMTACFLPSEPDLGGMPLHSVELFGPVALSAETMIKNDSVLVHVIIANHGTAPGGIQFGLCSFAVRGASPTHSWDNRLPPNAGCPDVGLGFEVPPGDIREWLAFKQAHTQLRQTGRAREYRVVVYYRDQRDAKLRQVTAGTVVF